MNRWKMEETKIFQSNKYVGNKPWAHQEQMCLMTLNTIHWMKTLCLQERESINCPPQKTQ